MSSKIKKEDLHGALERFVEQEIEELHKSVAVDFRCYESEGPVIHLWRDDGSGEDIRDVKLAGLIDEFIEWHLDDSDSGEESLMAAAKAFDKYLTKICTALKKVKTPK